MGGRCRARRPSFATAITARFDRPAGIDWDMKISPHANLGGARPDLGMSRDRLYAGMQTQGPFNAISLLIGEGVFDRFPKLKLYFAETNAGWLPHALNFADEWYQ